MGNNCAVYCQNKISEVTGEAPSFFRPKFTIQLIRWLKKAGLLDEASHTVLAPGPKEEQETPMEPPTKQ